jgi:hypothetical protein
MNTTHCTTLPAQISFSTTPGGSRCAEIRFPVAMALHARHLPNFTHGGVTYVPYTGEVIAPYRNNVTPERPQGYYMQYRALRSTPLSA